MTTLNSVTLTTTGDKTTTEGTDSSAPTAEDTLYSEFMKEYTSDFRGPIESYYYAFHDIDGNGVKEWFLGRMIGGEIRLCSVYVIKNGAVVQQEDISADYTDPNQYVVYKNGTVRIGGMGDDYWPRGYSYYRIESGELKAIASIYEDYRSVGDPDGYLRYDPIAKEDIPITKEEFDRLQKEFEGDGQVVDLDWKPLAEYGR